MAAVNGALVEFRSIKIQAVTKDMLRTRVLVLIFLIPAMIGVIIAGGWILAAALLVVLELAVWEYWSIFTKGGYTPSKLILMGGMLVLIVSYNLAGHTGRTAAVTFLVMLAMIVYIISYEAGGEKPATNLGITIGGIFCIGWLGTFLLPLRNLPNGLWWTLMVIPSAMLADTGGYIFGKWIGRHKLCPRLSPNKTWEGFFGGILFGVPLTVLIAWILHLSITEITLARGLIMGLVMAIFPIFGDLGVSMIKRQFGLKDTSNIIPGHGGVLDRFDTTFWAVPIGFYLITYLWL